MTTTTLLLLAIATVLAAIAYRRYHTQNNNNNNVVRNAVPASSSLLSGSSNKRSLPEGSEELRNRRVSRFLDTQSGTATPLASTANISSEPPSKTQKTNTESETRLRQEASYSKRQSEISKQRTTVAPAKPTPTSSAPTLLPPRTPEQMDHQLICNVFSVRLSTTREHAPRTDESISLPKLTEELKQRTNTQDVTSPTATASTILLKESNIDDIVFEVINDYFSGNSTAVLRYLLECLCRAQNIKRKEKSTSILESSIRVIVAYAGLELQNGVNPQHFYPQTSIISAFVNLYKSCFESSSSLHLKTTSSIDITTMESFVNAIVSREDEFEIDKVNDKPIFSRGSYHLLAPSEYLTIHFPSRYMKQ